MDLTRLTTTVAVLLAVASPAVAQGGRGSSNRQPSDEGPRERDAVSHVLGATPRHETHHQAPPPPQRTLWSDNAMRGRSPFSGGGLVPGGLNSPRPGVDAFRAHADTYALGDRRTRPGWNGRPGRPRGGGHGGSGDRATHDPVGRGVYSASVYSSGWHGASIAAAPVEAPRPSAPSGFLRLFVTPRRADVIVDGIYEGTADDFGGTGERTLASGVHRVRLETEGYEPVEFDVRIPDNDTITLRRDLYPRSPPPVPPAAAAPPTTAPGRVPRVIYAIPRCYLGDTPPRQEQLPAGCNIADLRTLD